MRSKVLPGYSAKTRKNFSCITIFYYIAELARAEKENSDWLPERSEFSHTDRKDGPLALNVRLKGAKCFNFV